MVSQDDGCYAFIDGTIHVLDLPEVSKNKYCLYWAFIKDQWYE